MLTLVFVFMILNLTSIWKLPTFSIGACGCDGVPRIVGTIAGFFVHGRTRKVALGTIPQWGQPLATILSPATPDSLVSRLPSQSDRSPPYPVGLNLACIVQRVAPSSHVIADPTYPYIVFW
jgi:hypothetical protein